MQTETKNMERSGSVSPEIVTWWIAKFNLTNNSIYCSLSGPHILFLKASLSLILPLRFRNAGPNYALSLQCFCFLDNHSFIVYVFDILWKS